jgi:hypothetical protein
LASTESIDPFANLPPEERAALEKIQSRNARLQYVYQNVIQELAEDGTRNGFWIHLAKDYRKIGESHKYFNPVTQKEESLPNKRLWEKSRFYYQGHITTEEFNEYAVYRGQMLNEANTAKAEDMATRLYELGAMRFLDMDHDVYVRARKDELRMAVDACFSISSWNGQIGLVQEEQVVAAAATPLEAQYLDPPKMNKPITKRKTFNDAAAEPDKELESYFNNKKREKENQ